MLIVAAQNKNRKLVETLITRGANINHQNKEGNTALHFVLEYDPKGTLAEYLIERGADDAIENAIGNTPYDGIETSINGFSVYGDQNSETSL